MPNHGGDQGGRPSLLTPDVQETICAAIRRGCYATVAATRAGVDDFTMSLWDKRGQREAEQRALGKVSEDTPESVYEQFHHALAKAKAEARYSAETRVFDAMPLAWLKSGYARNDWHQSNQLVREVVDELLKRVPPTGSKRFSRQAIHPARQRPKSSTRIKRCCASRT